jgi:hypothetical protein
MDEPRDKEDALAGLLNGTIFSVLGGAFPALLLWSVVTDWESVISRSHAMTSAEALQGVVLLAVSFPVLRYGIKMVTVSARAFQRL